MEHTLQELLDDGWRDAVEDPPNTSSLVCIAYDDGSSNGSLGFYDSVDTIPESSEKFWWEHSLTKLPKGSVIAWKEINETR